MINPLEIKERLSDHSATEGKGEKKPCMTIVIDNVIYLTCTFLGLIITKCDFRKAANQKESGASRGEGQGHGHSSCWELRVGKASNSLMTHDPQQGGPAL